MKHLCRISLLLSVFIALTIGVCADTGVTENEYIYPSTPAEVLKKAQNSEMSLMMNIEEEEEVERILDYAKSATTDVEKALAVNDYFVLNYCYDETYSIYNKEGLFSSKTGVCSAYADAYEYIMEDKLGIECVTVTSWEMNHAWNMLKIDGEWYHVDVTWNDPMPDSPGRAMHNFFLLSDSALSDEDHGHYEWEGGYPATSTKYDNYFWTNIRTPIIMSDGYYYYIDSLEGKVIRQHFEAGKLETIYEISELWDVWDKPGWYYSEKYAQIVCKDRTLYINTPTQILSMNINGTNVKTVETYDGDNGYIWGLTLSGDEITYFVSRDKWEYGIEEYITFSLSAPKLSGDVNGDGEVDFTDAIRILKYDSGIDTLPDANAADVNDDGTVDFVDAILILKYDSGLIPSFK